MTEPDPVQDFLEHYGKKGMKWGVRNDRSAASKLSTNAKTTGKTGTEKFGPKNSGHAGRKLSTSRPKKKMLKNAVLDSITAGFNRRHRAHAAKKSLRRLEGRSADTSTRRGRRKQKKIDQARLDAAFELALARPRKNLYVTKDGQTSVVKGKKFAKNALSRRPVLYDDIRLKP